VLIGPFTTVYYDSGFPREPQGFVGAIIGGLVSYPAAAAGALLVGLLEAFASYWASAFKEVIVFTLIIPVLLWRSLDDPSSRRRRMTVKPDRLALAVFVVVLVGIPLVAPQFWVTLGNYIGLYSIVALGLVLLTGVAGQTSFGQAAFVGLGAYTTAVLSVQYAISPWLSLFAGIGLTLALALCLGFITLRMKGHYLPLATIAWGISLYFLFGNVEILGGHTGLSGIPALNLFGLELRNERYFYFLIWGIALAALWATNNLLDSRPGRAVRALRGHIEMAEAFGVDAARLKIVVFVYAAILASISGWLYAHLQRFVNPTPFGINQGIEYLFMAVVGGAGSVWGAVVGGDADYAGEAIAPGLSAIAARQERQLRDRRIRHPHGGPAAKGTRRRLAVDCAPRAARGASGDSRRTSAAVARQAREHRHAARRPRCAQDVRRSRGGQQVVVRDPARRDPRLDRPERSGQEHDVQPDLGRAGADVGRHRLRR
jgi:ABC-type branched-subunit amino acid transport system permease subunit